MAERSRARIQRTNQLVGSNGARYTAEVSEERYPLGDGYALFRRGVRFLRVEEFGNPLDADEMTRYFAAIERSLVAAHLSGLLIVAQRTGANPLSPHWVAIREARWKALASSRAKRIAVLVEDDLGISRVQMTAVAKKAPVRAFLDEASAIAWLTA